MVTIKLQNLSIGYLIKGTEKVVAPGLTAELYSGELTCLLGRNGIGKSTLLRTLCAFQPKLGGQLLMGGRDIDSYTAAELSREIGVVLTEKPDVKNMTVTEMVALGRSPYTGFWGRLQDEDRQIVDEALQQVGIDHLRHRLVHTLSDGERQKVMIAKALAQQTPVIYLDEPTAFLDFPSKVETLQLLSRLASEQQKTILMSTHDVELALQLSDRIWLMEPEGLSVGTAQSLAASGVLPRFIEHDGIIFDQQTLTVRINKS